MPVVLAAVLLPSCCHAACLVLPYEAFGEDWAEPSVTVAVEGLKGWDLSAAGVLYLCGV